MATPKKITNSPYPMVDVDKALNTVLTKCETLALELIDMKTDGPESFLDRVLAEDVRSVENLPPFPASMMDGYAVVAKDGKGTFDVCGSATAGSEPIVTYVASGSVVYITTGAPMPKGTDAVVPIEDTEEIEGHRVVVKKAVRAGQWVRPIGSDVRAGDTVLDKHTVISATEVGLLACVGATRVKVYKRPTLAVFSTGDELVQPWESLRGGKIRDSNRPMLCSAAVSAGAIVRSYGIVKDQEVPLKELMMSALNESDIIVTSGGVSMGSLDLVKPLLEEIGNVHFGRMCMKPGKPTTFATVVSEKDGRTKLIFGLPGNPVSCMVVFRLLVDPAIKALSGIPLVACHHSRVHARLKMPLTLDPKRPEYHRAHLSWRETLGSPGEFIATSTGVQQSSRLLSMRSSTALLCLPSGTGTLKNGAVVPALLLGSQIPPPERVTPHMDGYTLHGASDASLGKDLGKNTVPHGEPSCPCCKIHGKSTTSNSIHVKDPPRYGGSFVHPKSTVLRVGILTVSDRASRGVYGDLGGPEIMTCLADHISSLWETDYRVVGDEKNVIEASLCDFADRTNCNLVITTGGTGPSLRDVTPDATMAVCDRIFPGFGERMRQISGTYVPTAILSRQVVGTRGQCLIVNLPGSPSSIRQILPEIFEPLAHMLFLLNASKIVLTKTLDTPLNVRASDFIVDVVNKKWIDEKLEKFGNGTITAVVEKVLDVVKEREADENSVFTIARGCGRKKAKTSISLSLSPGYLAYLKRMQMKYNIADIQKTLRIILDFALEGDEGGEVHGIF
jgi:gephyrin